MFHRGAGKSVQGQDEVVHIVNQGNQHAIDLDQSKTVNGTEILVYPKHSPSTPNQQWRLEHTSSNKVMISSALDQSKVIDVPGASKKSGTKCILYEKSGSPNQLWEMSGVIFHSAIGHDLVLAQHGGDHGSLVIETKNGKPNQEWQIVSCPGGIIQLINQGNQHAVDLDNSKTVNGSELLVYPKHSPATPNQQWRLEHTKNNKVMISSALDQSKVIDVPGASKKSGTKCILYEKSGSTNQQWEMSGIVFHSAIGHDLVLAQHGGDHGSLIVETKNDKPNQMWQIVTE